MIYTSTKIRAQGLIIFQLSYLQDALGFSRLLHLIIWMLECWYMLWFGARCYHGHIPNRQGASTTSTFFAKIDIIMAFWMCFFKGLSTQIPPNFLASTLWMINLNSRFQMVQEVKNLLAGKIIFHVLDR